MPALVLAADIDEFDTELQATIIDEGLQEPSETEALTVEDSVDQAIEQQPVEPITIPVIEEQPEEPVATVEQLSILISKLQTGPVQSEFIELFNYGDSPVVLDGWRLEYLSASHNGNSTPTRVLVTISTTINPQEYYIAKHSGFELVGADVDFDSNLTNGSIAKSGGAVRLVGSNGGIIDMIGWGGASQFEASPLSADETSAWQRCSTAEISMVDLNNNLLDFVQYDFTELRATPQCPVEDVPAPVNNCSGVFISEIGANIDEQFIELYNPTYQDIELSGCLVQTNRSATNTHLLEGIIGPESYYMLMVADTDLTLTKTTTGIVFLISSDANSETDLRSYSDLKSGTSWMWDGGDEWRQTYQPTPGYSNVWQEFLPCDIGYERNADTGMCRKKLIIVPLAVCGEGRYRSEETGRCRNIVSTPVLVPCKDNQYRSEETGRCRNIASTASALKPCRDDQYRSEETNRCRSLATVVNALVPCAEGQERNPETNRCRNIVLTDIPDAAFKVEPVSDSISTFAGWWALGGIGLVALGYAGYEWRTEFIGGLRRLGAFLSSSK